MSSDQERAEKWCAVERKNELKSRRALLAIRAQKWGREC
jgi:hypothetical protein